MWFGHLYIQTVYFERRKIGRVMFWMWYVKNIDREELMLMLNSLKNK